MARAPSRKKRLLRDKEAVERYLDCGNPRYGGAMCVVAFLTEHAVVDRIIDHLKRRFVQDGDASRFRTRPRLRAEKETLIL